MMNDKTTINRYSWFSAGFFVACLSVIMVTACVDEWAIGKSREELNEELAKSMFEVDSLIYSIQYMYGDTLER